jgi:type I restriction enzyme S subunit
MSSIQLPKHWQIKKLGEVCNVLDNLRKPINSSERQQRIAGKSQDELYPYYGATGQVGWIDNFLTDGEFILIGEDGAPFLDIYKDKAYKIKGKTWVNNHAHILKGKEQLILDDFALYYLNSINYREFVNGTTRLKLTKSNLVEIPFALPPLPEQQAIVAKIEELLSELENGKQQLQTTQQQLKVYRQSLLKWAFEGRFGYAQRPPNSLKDGELPKGWKWVTLGEVCNKIGDIDHKMPKQLTSGYPYVSTKDFTDDLKISFENAKYISKEDYLNLSRKIKPEKGDIIFPRYGTIGKNILVDFDKEFLVSYSCAVVKPNQHLVLSKYVYLFTLSPKVTEEIRKYTVETTQANVGIASIKSFVFPLPSLSEQQYVVAELESKLTVCDKIEETISQSLQQAETLRQSILKRAFEGKLLK